MNKSVSIGKYAQVRVFDPSQNLDEYKDTRPAWLSNMLRHQKSQSRGEHGKDIKSTFPIDTQGEYSPLN